MLPISTPPIPDTTAEITQDRAKMCFTEIPIDWATCWLKAVARIATPGFEYLKKPKKPGKRRREKKNPPTTQGERGGRGLSIAPGGKRLGAWTGFWAPQTAP